MATTYESTTTTGRTGSNAMYWVIGALAIIALLVLFSRGGNDTMTTTPATTNGVASDARMSPADTNNTLDTDAGVGTGTGSTTGTGSSNNAGSVNDSTGTSGGGAAPTTGTTNP